MSNRTGTGSLAKGLNVAAVHYGACQRGIFCRSVSIYTVRGTYRTQAVINVLTCALLRTPTPAGNRMLGRSTIESWTLRRSLQAAALPAAGYALQSWLAQCAYANLDSLTFNLLNQTKTLFAALCLYLVMGKRQSRTQLVALSLFIGAALLLNAGNCNGSGNASSEGKSLFGSGHDDGRLERLWLGVLPVLGASFLSGLFGAVTQRTLQTGYNSFQLSLELAVYGVASLLLTCGLEISSSGGTQGLFQGWTPLTCVPVLSQAAGGVIVGQVSARNAVNSVV